MNWWKRWKAKHWDEVDHPAGDNGFVFWTGHTETPKFRAVVRRLIEQAEENPLGAIAVVAAILGAIAAIMTALL